MSSSLDKVAGITDLPIFPLPLVIMPNEILPLHLFERRYRQMLDDIGGVGGIFGITLLDHESSLSERPEVGSVGCAAEIRDVQTMDDGRSNIIIIGVARYRLVDLIDDDKPYLVGDVAFFEDVPDESADPENLAGEVFDLFMRMANAVSKMNGSRIKLPEISRSDPESLSFLAAATLGFENELKYRLLEMTSTVERLESIRKTLTQSVAQIEDRTEIVAAAKTNGHSKKKLDI